MTCVCYMLDVSVYPDRSEHPVSIRPASGVSISQADEPRLGLRRSTKWNNWQAKATCPSPGSVVGHEFGGGRMPMRCETRRSAPAVGVRQLTAA